MNENNCTHIVAYANKSDAVPCPVCERDTLRTALDAATASGEELRKALEKAREDLAISWGKAEGHEATRLANAMRLVDMAIIAATKETHK